MRTLELLDDTSRDQIQLAVLGGEIKEFARINQRRAGNPHVHLLRSIAIEGGDVIGQLRTADDGVVAEDDAAAVQQLLVRYQLHLGHQLTDLLRGRGEATRPCRRIFDQSPLVRDTATVGVTDGETDTRIRHSSHVVSVTLILLTHQATSRMAGEVDVLILIRAHRIAVVYPQERAYLHLLAGSAQLLVMVGEHLDNLPRTDIVARLIAQVMERARLTGNRIAILTLRNNDRQTTQFVTTDDDTVLRQQHDGAGPFDFFIDILDTLLEGVRIGNKQSDQLRLVDLTGAHLRERHFLVQQLLT